MTPRQLWQDIMHYRPFDRMPVVHWDIWPETYERWHKEGMPRGINQRQYFNAVPHMIMLQVNLDLFPLFEEEIMEETTEYKKFRDNYGVIQQQWKNRSSIPHYVDFTFKTAKDWPQYKKRLQPCPSRIPANIDETIANAENKDAPTSFWCGSLMGWIRNWMGLENMSYLMYDNQDVYTDVVNTIADLACWAIDQIVPKLKSPPDMGHLWEDICGKTGPLVSPKLFNKCVAPAYIKIRKKLEEYGTSLLSIDCDGDISELIGNWLDAGVNVQIPMEIGTWNTEPMAYRKKYGKELRIIGGLNKLVLEKDEAAIDAEIKRRKSLMKDGGFVLMPDHLITPDTPLENYKYYLERIRQLRF